MQQNRGYGKLDLESITSALREKGIRKGQDDAERIIREAKEQAASILKEAADEKEKLLQSAEEEAQHLSKQFHSQMKLAGRDFIIGLQKTMEDTLALKPMRQALRDALSSSEFIKKLIISMVEQYVEADSRARHQELEITVPEGMKEDVMKALIGHMREQLDLSPTILVGKGTEGFIFSLGKKGDVVIDVESVMEAIKPYISQKFHEFLQTGL
ncbi:MAG: hypothetical protein Q8P24_05365 [Desulfobacterales bacterium]|nr:hypothetical protein [Desulfobacterales bacterium]